MNEHLTELSSKYGNLPGPCIVCGRRNYPLSMGGPSICPACDCGIDPQLAKYRDERAKLAQENIDMGLTLDSLIRPEMFSQYATPQMRKIVARIIAGYKNDSRNP